MTCPTCKGERWVCEEHDGLPRRHNMIAELEINGLSRFTIVECKSAGDPCPICNKGSPPEMPPDFTVIDKAK